MFLQHPGQEILIFLVADMDGVTSERSPSSQVFFFFLRFFVLCILLK